MPESAQLRKSLQRLSLWETLVELEAFQRWFKERRRSAVEGQLPRQKTQSVRRGRILILTRSRTTTHNDKELSKIWCKPTMGSTNAKVGELPSLKEPRRLQAVAKVEDHDPLIMTAAAKEYQVSESCSHTSKANAKRT